MYEVAENFRAAADAVLVADLVHNRQYALAMEALHILAEKAEAAEAIGFVPQILRYKPEYKTAVTAILALNLQQLRRKAYAHDEGYRHYVALLYQQAACGMAKAGFTKEAETVLQKLEAAGFEQVLAISLPKQVVFEHGVSLMPAKVTENRTEKTKQVVVSVSDEPMKAPIVEASQQEVSEIVETASDMAEEVVAKVSDMAAETVEKVSDMAEETVEVSVVPVAGEEVLPQPSEAEKIAPELQETEVERDDAQPIKAGEEVNINKVLNININEIDKHFEQIKQITADAVKKAELQAEKLKKKVQGQKMAASSLAKIKEIAQSASYLSKQKAGSVVPKIQKLKKYADKFLKKDNKP